MAIRLAAPRDKQPTMSLLVGSERTFIPPLAPLTREVKRVLLDTQWEVLAGVWATGGRGSYSLHDRPCAPRHRQSTFYPNQITTPISHRLSPEQTITVIDPRHPLCGRTLPLVAMTYHANLGRCCVVWLRPHVERLVPIQATNLEFDPNEISPSPLTLAAVEHLLCVVHDIEQASKGVNCDANSPCPSGATPRSRPPDCPPSALGVPVHEPTGACSSGSDPCRATGARSSATSTTI
jgi:hypothetical protein